MYNVTPIKHFLWLWNLFLFISILGLLAALSYFKRSMESFALVLFFTGFFIVIPGFASRPEVGIGFEPYWLYFSSIGFFIFVALMLLKLKSRINKWYFVLLLSMLLMFFFIQTQKLNLIARTQLSYCENWLHRSPGNKMASDALSGEYIYNDYKIPQEFFVPISAEADRYLRKEIMGPRLNCI